jgi:hypothetical protein
MQAARRRLRNALDLALGMDEDAARNMMRAGRERDEDRRDSRDTGIIDHDEEKEHRPRNIGSENRRCRRPSARASADPLIGAGHDAASGRQAWTHRGTKAGRTRQGARRLRTRVGGHARASTHARVGRCGYASERGLGRRAHDARCRTAVGHGDGGSTSSWRATRGQLRRRGQGRRWGELATEAERGASDGPMHTSQRDGR